MPRASGILLHPTSLPGPYGIGDLGPSAWRFAATLAEAGQSYWQILPLGPTGYGDSPYQTFSAFAGNPLLISPEALLDDGLILPDEAEQARAGRDDSAEQVVGARQDDAGERGNPASVDFAGVIARKTRLLDAAFRRFERVAAPSQRDEVDRFARTHAAWLGDFALFMALKDAFGGRAWPTWDADIAARDPEALRRWSATLHYETRRHAFAQYLFFSQWEALRARVAAHGIRLIGDAPIFVAHDSADCWTHRELFHLHSDGTPELVAGVPPDYFSATGQLWGNPLYRWEVAAQTGYAWWIERLRMVFSLVDLLRLDHFRGFAGYWAIPGDAPTAETGEWLPGPGAALFRAAQAALGPLPIIAEDLGVITPDVVALRDEFGFPGMRVLQFAFGGDASNYDLPHNYVPHSVVYTGTHDNDTAAGWFAAATPELRRHLLAYAASSGAEPVWDLIRLAWASVADLAIMPLQDVLELDSAARMNLPGKSGGNWQWRLLEGQFTPAHIARLAALTELYGRRPAAATVSPAATDDATSD